MTWAGAWVRTGTVVGGEGAVVVVVDAVVVGVALGFVAGAAAAGVVAGDAVVGDAVVGGAVEPAAPLVSVLTVAEPAAWWPGKARLT